MSNYSLVANSTFQPFTYQELAMPLDRTEAYHEKLADEYDKLSAQADVLEAMGANERDKNSQAYYQYKAYSDKLRAEADNLYRNGLNTESRMRLSDLRRMYNTDIVPIQNAWTKREAEAQMQLKARMDAAAKGIDIRFSRDAANTPIQSYLENPNQTFDTINGQALTQEIANQFKGLASQIQVDKNGTAWVGKKQLSPIEYEIITQSGMDFNKYADFINNPDDPNYSTIRGIINNTLAAHNIQNFDADTQRAMFNYAAQGVSAGVGKRDMQFHTDPYATMRTDWALKEQSERNKAARAATGDGSTESPFSVSEYDLPMYGADYSNSKDQRKAIETLGYKYNDSKKKFEATGKVSIGGKDVSLYDNKGNILSRDQFVRQAGTEKERRDYQNYYDKVKKAGDTLGFGNNGFTQRDVARTYNTLRENSAAQMARTYSLNYEKNDWNPTSREYKVREIVSYKDGKPVYSSDSVSLNDLLNRKDKDKKDINVSAHWSNVEGNQGLILSTTEDGKPHRYFIDASTMPESNIRAAREYFDRAKNAKTEKAKQDFIIAALGSLHTGLTVHPKPADLDVVKQSSK